MRASRMLCAVVVLTSGLAIASATQDEPAINPVAQPASKAPAVAPRDTQAGTTRDHERDAREDEDLAEPRETEIVLKDRRRVTGRLVEVTNESVVLNISGIPTTFKLDLIEAIRELPTVSERYVSLRASIADDDVEGLLRLAEWLRARGRLTLALREVEGVLEQAPGHQGARDLKTVLTEQLKLKSQQGTQQRPRRDTDANAPEKNPKIKPASRADASSPDFPLLTDEQMNMVRLFEVDLRDPPKMIIKRDTRQRFLDKFEGTIVEGKGIVPVSPEAREQFYRMKAPQVLSWFFDLRAREFYPEVQILENPKALELFRDNVHRTWLINSCATSRCHGGEEAGSFYLYNKNQTTDRSAITNWVIIDAYRTSEGTGLIDFKDPARSPLLQMGLRRDKAIIKHPEVTGIGRRWQPVFDSQSDPRFRKAVEWILTLYPNRAGYPIDYTPPKPGAATSGASTNAQPAPPQPR